jgi:acetolactate synthase-1/2/3 large subunit
VCVRSDHKANLAVPEEMLARFFEVYSGPVEEGVTAPL